MKNSEDEKFPALLVVITPTRAKNKDGFSKRIQKKISNYLKKINFATIIRNLHMKHLIIFLHLILIKSLFLMGQNNCKYYFGINEITSITSSDEDIYIGTDSRIIVVNKNSQLKNYLTPYSIGYSETVPSYFSLNYNQITGNLISIGGYSKVIYEINNAISTARYKSYNPISYCSIDKLWRYLVNSKHCFKMY
ncbi:MAG TPA: hypothetical protein DDX39_02475 [Bacteroidales bacterium]|nr:MAG: hypothetical protein A2W98_03490 [Bacteroidetes bacterium GWF2_33_38]OFY67931.1 MAG: hypothetical protein A2265_03535 [Bacteroidetes bacterium RIFOXYA12_FULL_33_9]OFY85283.1 MAG: hypothetical protein A2236_11350 [Bacteroidetes bacterium RIFOXYA2_FULL_33_7]HBF87481.1 hypothetical protein [Bacteroidales bacterium]